MIKVKTKFKVKIFIDLCMAIALLLLMAYSLIGEGTHEWIGAGMFVLVIVHNILNLNWYRNLLKEKYTVFRVFQLILDISIFLSMIGLMISGIMLSRYVFSFMPIKGGTSFARTLHMLSAYWGFTLMSLHVGLHTNMMINAIKKAVRITKTSAIRTTVLRMLAAGICIYGAYAFVQRQLPSYMLLKNQFVFFDFNEPLVFFFADYLSIMGLFTCIGHYISAALRKLSARKTVDYTALDNKIV